MVYKVATTYLQLWHRPSHICGVHGQHEDRDIVGHEFLGVVEDFSPEMKSLKKGTKISSEQANCSRSITAIL
jgi:D-arabinose 1-dehydrogenase-like Zn-dependent alcohol dehydrogenase